MSRRDRRRYEGAPIRRRELLWAAIAAGLAGVLAYRWWRKRRAAAALPQPRPGLPPYPHQVV